MIIALPQHHLTQLHKETIMRLWNNEYPHQLAFSALADVDAYLNNLHHQTHYFAIDETGQIRGWAFKFVREGEKWFAMILDSSVHQKGLGTKLLSELKQHEKELNGWAIDHERYTKSNGDIYSSPIQFYLKNDFVVCNESRLETETLSAVKIRWNNQQIKMVQYLPAHQAEIDTMMQQIAAEFLLPPPPASYKPDLPDFYWVAMFNDKFMGTIALNKIGDYGVLKRMFLLKEFRGTGVSQVMFHTALECCMENRLNTLYLGTIDQFVAAQKFYAKNGFSKIERSELPADFPHNPIDTLFYVRNNIIR